MRHEIITYFDRNKRVIITVSLMPDQTVSQLMS